MSKRMMHGVAMGMIAAIATALVACVPSRWMHGDVAADSIRVATYNIRTFNADKGTPNAWADRRDDLADLIRRLRVGKHPASARFAAHFVRGIRTLGLVRFGPRCAFRA